ncbi:Lrp/AsnC family transcriptional regulator [Streptomyces cavernicola]|uniref:Lrp/AsnC family transcriptional regulator n=1 Tax=Streptomyces cavernicola TaxID=3043613 RepID=A0ABT6S799_9ACTN|nr:Lrp/AsnC family transcriptional regulator [Streptomyces sp. B-S-A6]MDI3403196.1 Lrp/AsnC family transcriptional regulator [Streptomyces sp. B-S-A6]
MHSVLAEQDLALLHALQIAPRVSWTDAARVLGSTSTTLATRWNRLRSTGRAWVTVHPARDLRNAAVAFVDVEVVPAERDEVIQQLCRDPRAVTVEEAASGRDLMVTVVVPDQESLTRFVLDDLPRAPGVRSIRSRVATEMHREGADWRLDALDRDQQAAFQALVPRAEAARMTEIPASYGPLVQALTYDGRRSAAEIAALVGRNPATVRRQISRLANSGLLSFRCEITQLRSRWPVVCTWFAQVSAQQLERTVRSLRTLPDLRLCASTAGETNLMFTLWLSAPQEVPRVERTLAERLPQLSLVESVLMLRAPKRMGWLIDAEGRSTGEVVPSPARTGGTPQPADGTASG